MSPELVVVSKKNEPIFYSPSRLNGTVGGGMSAFVNCISSHRLTKINIASLSPSNTFNENRQSSRRRIHLRC